MAQQITDRELQVLRTWAYHSTFYLYGIEYRRAWHILRACDELLQRRKNDQEKVVERKERE